MSGEHDQIESSARQWHAELQHQSAMSALVEREEFNLCAILRPKITRDGELYCCLYGDNLQDGVAGFGDTPFKAVVDFNCAWHKSGESK